MIAFFPDNSQYIIIGFEDEYGGGDQDCNDLMFVVDVGPNNAAASCVMPTQHGQVVGVSVIAAGRRTVLVPRFEPGAQWRMADLVLRGGA